MHGGEAGLRRERQGGRFTYHPAWRERRDAEKFTDMLAFAQRLPAMRATVEDRLGAKGETRERILALASGCSTSASSGSAGTATRATTDTSD